jgi:hypothetical protein
MREFEVRTKETAVTRAKGYATGLAQALVKPAVQRNPELGTPSAAEVSSETWRVRRLRPDPELYAPVLELASDEPVLPSKTEIWETADLERLSLSKKAREW